MSLSVGDAVPEFTFLRPDGSALRLAEVAARPLVLIFLRHLA